MSASQKMSFQHNQVDDLSIAPNLAPIAEPVPFSPRTTSTTTTWTAGNGNFNTAADWSSGVPELGVSAYVQATSTAPVTITYSGGSDTASSLSTTYTTLDLSAGTLTLQNASSLTSAAGAFSQTGGEIDFQNGESLNQTSLIEGNASSITQTAGIIQVDQGSLGVQGNSSFAGTVAGLSGGGTLVLDSQYLGANYTIEKGADFTIGELVLNDGTTTIDSGATIATKEFALSNSASLVLATNLTYNGTFADISGPGANFIQLAGHTFRLSGTAELESQSYTVTVAGAGTLALAGTSTLGTVSGGAGVELAAGAVLANTGKVTQNFTVQIGDSSGATSSISNAAGASWNLTTSAGLTTGVNASSSFANAGLFEATGTNASPTVYASFSNTGTISAAATDGIFFATLLTNTGTITGAGQVGITGGTATLSTGTALSIGQFDLSDNATLILGTNLAYAGFFDDESSGSNYLDLAGHTLSLSGTVNLESLSYTVNVIGPGTLALSGTSLIGQNGGSGGSGLELGAGAALTNSGKVVQNGFVQIGDNSSAVSSIANAAGAVWDITTSNGIYTGSDISSSFLNAGLFEDTGTFSAPTITATFSNTGTISVAGNDALYFNNNFTNTGTITGAGQVAISGGTATIGTGTVLNISQFDLQNTANLALAENLTYAGVFSDFSNGTNTLSLAGHTLSLTGTAYLESDSYFAVVEGPGTIALSGTTTIGQNGSGGGAVLGGGAALTNTSSVVQNGNLQVGDTSGLAASVSNSATGTWNITTNTAITTGTTGSSTFTNAGLFENTGTDDAIQVHPVFTNTGTIDAVSAGESIYFTGGGTFKGTLEGAGGISFGGGSLYTIASGTTLSVASLNVVDFGTSVTLAATETYSGTLTQSSNTTVTLATAKTELALKGTATLSGTVTGLGTILVSGAGNFISDGLTLGSAVVLEDDKATISQGQQLTIGNNSASTASLTVLAGSTYRITADVGIGSDGTGAIVNAGLFEKTGLSGISVISPLVTNTGTLASVSGTLDFASNVTNTGTISASAGHTVEITGSLSSAAGTAGVIDLTDGGLAQFGGYVGSTQTLTFLDTSRSQATLANPGEFSASIKGFGGSNALVLDGLQNVQGSYAGSTSSGVLTITETENGNPVVVAQLDFVGDYTAANFSIANISGAVQIDYTTGSAPKVASAGEIVAHVLSH